MWDLDDVARLYRVSPEVLCSLLHERAHPHAAPPEQAWDSDAPPSWWVLSDALAAAAAGERPRAPRGDPPAWLDRVVRRRVRQLAGITTPWGEPLFQQVRALERAGLVELEVDDDYALALLAHFGFYYYGCDNVRQLREDPELLEGAVWRLLEVEGPGTVNLRNHDSGHLHPDHWDRTFLTLTADGTLDRDRVMRACLAALARDFGAWRDGWYTRTYDHFQPTTTELAAHQGALAIVLSSRISSSASWALRHLVTLDKAGGLDDDLVADTFGAAVAHPAAATVKLALRVLGSVGRTRPDLRERVVELVTEALEHPKADVRSAAARVLRTLGVDAAPPAPAPLPPDPTPQPQPVRVAVPVTSDDLLERLGALLEDAPDPWEVELVLSGLAELDEPGVLAPLLRRAAAIHKRGPETSGGSRIGYVLADTVLRGLGRPPEKHVGADYLDNVEFLLGRVDQVAASLTGRAAPGPLLATPTAPGGWIDPLVLVHRILDSPTPPRRLDLVAALLRVGPDGRAEALAAARSVDGEVGAVLRHALGDQPPELPTHPGRNPAWLQTPAWWVAASRSRAPLEDDPLLLAVGLDRAGPSASRPRGPQTTAATVPAGRAHRRRRRARRPSAPPRTTDHGARRCRRVPVLGPR